MNTKAIHLVHESTENDRPQRRARHPLLRLLTLLYASAIVLSAATRVTRHGTVWSAPGRFAPTHFLRKWLVQVYCAPPGERLAMARRFFRSVPELNAVLLEPEDEDDAVSNVSTVAFDGGYTFVSAKHAGAMQQLAKRLRGDCLPCRIGAYAAVAITGFALLVGVMTFEKSKDAVATAANKISDDASAGVVAILKPDRIPSSSSSSSSTSATAAPPLRALVLDQTLSLRVAAVSEQSLPPSAYRGFEVFQLDDDSKLFMVLDQIKLRTNESRLFASSYKLSAPGLSVVPATKQGEELASRTAWEVDPPWIRQNIAANEIAANDLIGKLTVSDNANISIEGIVGIDAVVPQKVEQSWKNDLLGFLGW